MVITTVLTAIQYKLPSIIPQVLEAGLLEMNTITLLNSIFALAGMVFAIPAGALVAKVGPKKTILLAALIAAIASLAVFAGNDLVLIIFRVLDGVALYTVLVSGPVLIQEVVEPSKRGIATGIYISGGVLGAFVAGVITPLFFNMGGLVGDWAGYGILALLSGILIFFAIKDQSYEAFENYEVEDAFSDNSKQLPEEKPSYIRIFTKNTVLLLVSFILIQIMILGTINYSPTFLQQNGLNANLSGIISTLPMLLAVLASVAFGAIADKTGKFKLIYLVGYGSMCVGTFLMFAGTGFELWTGVVIMGLLGMGSPAIALAAFPQMLRSPSLVSIGMGVMIVAQCFGQFLGTVIPSFALGEALSNWTLMQFSVVGFGLAGFICAALCSFKRGT